ncbi:nitrate regulatory gene2 protein isoform X2 [Malania oleifera]|uniref:nitrate regulatory gene2 protein isoform X2 n=1 Tax=Malania oleifera TaxID=397392 RepID=UPI0025AE6CB0|nr:nitrate regulatory gene2 protein isoform X2 [Malania oleifera]XP_057953754.1 nitrate regulatory gene2 protein isoform X2 [Malania oleifera]
MGVSSSRIEEDKALQLCRERKKFVKQALDGRCSLAASHVTYVDSLNSVGTALRKFVKPQAPVESSLYTSTNATPEPLALTEKSLSQFSFSSPALSQRVDATETFSPSPSPTYSSRFQANHMKFRGSFSRKVEEKPSLPVLGTVTSSTTPQNTTPRSGEIPEKSPFEADPLSNGTPAWDYFGLFHSTDNQFSFTEGGRWNQDLESADDVRRLREEEGIPELEDEEDKESFSSRERDESQESEDEFDEPSTDTLVRSFENLNRASNHEASASHHVESIASTPMPSAKSVASETEPLSHEKNSSPNLSPLQTASSAVAAPTDTKRMPVKEDGIENKVSPKDLFSSMKDIEYLFIKASDSGKEVPRMLEANKLHFRPITQSEEGGSVASTIFKACFSCGEDPRHVPEEPAQTSVKYLTWHRTVSSRSSPSRNPLGSNSNAGIEDLHGDLFENVCMISGSHASTLDRLYAWERKLYDEIKASQTVRNEYDMKCKILRQLESKGESSHRIDKTRAVVKDLHSRIRVAIHRIDHISKKIEQLRDKELQPQLEELIKGLSHMWEVMSECHKLQFHIISVVHSNGNTRVSIGSEDHRQITIRLESELSYLSSSFLKWIGAQKSYLQAINGWLLKCVSLQQKPSSKRKSRAQNDNWKNSGPPIYVTCGAWLNKLNQLHPKDVADSIKGLAAEISHFLPRQEKGQGRSMNNLRSNASDSTADLLVDTDGTSDDWNFGFDRFRSSLVGFLGQLNKFAKDSVNMYTQLENEIGTAKRNYEQKNNQDRRC